jgi:hypothetical protein
MCLALSRIWTWSLPGVRNGGDLEPAVADEDDGPGLAILPEVAAGELEARLGQAESGSRMRLKSPTSSSVTGSGRVGGHGEG